MQKSYRALGPSTSARVLTRLPIVSPPPTSALAAWPRTSSAGPRVVQLERRQRELVNEAKQSDSRIDSVLAGALGQSVRGHESRISTTEAHVRDLEARLAAVETKVSGRPSVAIS